MHKNINLKVGSNITIDGNSYKVTGIGSVPDYDACYEKLSDSTVDSKQFGLAFVTEDVYQNLKNNEKHDIPIRKNIFMRNRFNGAMNFRSKPKKLN